MVYRVYVEKKIGLRLEADAQLSELRQMLGLPCLKSLRLLNRYDADKISAELFELSLKTVFSEPQIDDIFQQLPSADHIFAVEYLPGQFDQRADSAAQCIQLISAAEKPLIRTARVYLLEGQLSEKDIQKIKDYLINPVESQEASLDIYQTLQTDYPQPQRVESINGFISFDLGQLQALLTKMALAMDIDDLLSCQEYFESEQRDPTITEIRVLDTYWSDHCRHTTFLTNIDKCIIEDSDVACTFQRYQKTREELDRSDKPITLMDIATQGARYLKAKGKLPNLDESPEVNACTVKIKVKHDEDIEDWLLLFKNETHNHPTEIEPFGGAATCLGGAIRDPLSGRAYVYQAMRLTGAADPTQRFDQTLPGKLPQRKIVTEAAAGYSSYGNQIGLATGIVDEWYHPGYAAKRMEIGAVIGAAPAVNVRREVPADGDLVLLIGGRTGRDGCGGATGSSKSHDLSSLEECGAEVQKGNPPEERKIQRLFRIPQLARLIKRCNDFGAGGVSVAIGELADGIKIDLDAVPKKYAGLDGTELAISESQERMAVVIAEQDLQSFLEYTDAENLEAAIVARVSEEHRLQMNWQGQQIVDISRDFLDTNGADKHTQVKVAPQNLSQKRGEKNFIQAYKKMAGDLNCCSKRGLAERFDSTIGAGSVLMPFGGKLQLTPTQAMVAKIPVLTGETSTCSMMSWGFDPYLSEQSPYHGSYLAVLSSVQKLIACGAKRQDCYFSFQEYFPKLGDDPKRWGQPFAALLGALAAQLDLGLAAIGGKDSMSGTFEDIDVPPTLASFAVATADIDKIISPEFKKADSSVVLLQAKIKDNGLPEEKSILELITQVEELIEQGKVLAAYVPGYGGIAEAVMQMSFGNDLGFEFDAQADLDTIFGSANGAFILELAKSDDIGIKLGKTTKQPNINKGPDSIPLEQLLQISKAKLEGVFPTDSERSQDRAENFNYNCEQYPIPSIKCVSPSFLLPVFPGTNCEYDTARAIERVGGKAKIIVINNLTPEGIVRSVEEFAQAIESTQAIVIPGGFSAGDEPDGSGKFITAFFRNQAIKEAVDRLLSQKDGLMCGICNGFQALIKLGLVPYGKIIDPDPTSPTLTFNTIGRHQSRLVRTRIASNKSPWLARTKVGDIYTAPISHGEGRFYCSQELITQLADNGQIASQYVDLFGNASMDIDYNPNGSFAAVEGITSPDGRVLGKMGHSERISNGLYQNVPGNYQIGLFASAIDYFKL